LAGGLPALVLGAGLAASARAADNGDLPAADATAPAHAVAAPVPPATPVEKLERPWNMGVTEQRQTAARAHLKEGNALLKNSQFREAAERYRQGLSEWDHPGLHFNLALALINLDDQPVELYEQLQMAVRYGAAPLGDEKYERAKDSLKLAKKQIAEIDVRCDVRGAVVVLDGSKELFRVGDTPGQWKGFLVPGLHTVTAAKDGFATTERSKVLLPGQPAVFTLKLYKADELIGYRRRWPLWRPVAVTVAGVALLAVGGVMTLEARDRFNAFDAYSANSCAAGCQDDPELARLQSEANRFKMVGAFLYAAGGVAVAAGVALLVVDRAVPYQVNPDVDRMDGKGVALARFPAVTPWLGIGNAGVLGTWRF
jgi:hypothetical protein